MKKEVLRPEKRRDRREEKEKMEDRKNGTQNIQ